MLRSINTTLPTTDAWLNPASMWLTIEARGELFYLAARYLGRTHRATTEKSDVIRSTIQQLETQTKFALSQEDVRTAAAAHEMVRKA
jgi:hypothetical protein